MKERYCRECGTLITGRADKIFCSDMCRTSFHNREYRVEKAGLEAVNAILAANRRILLKLSTEGVVSLPLSDIRMRGFCPGHYTSSQRHGRHTIYHCYEYRYEIKRHGLTYFCYICGPITNNKN